MRTRRLGRSVLGITMLVLLLAALGWSLAASADVRITFRVPQGTEPVFLTENDASGHYRVLRVGRNAYKLVNFDDDVSFRLVHDKDLAEPETTVENGGSNGPDPVPTLRVTWSQDVQSVSIDLAPGQASTCRNCDLEIKVDR